MGKGRLWFRGALTLALVGGLAAALVTSPVGAAFTPTKAKIKKIAKKEATKVFNGKIGGAIGGKQDKCAEGTVIAYALINVDTVTTSTTAFSTTGVSPQFNCAGGPVEARYNSDSGEYNIRIPGVTTGAGGSSGIVANFEFVNIDCDIGFALCTSGGQVFASSYGTDPAHDHLSVLLQYEDNTNTVDNYAKGECAGFFFAGQCALAMAVYTK